MLDLFQPETLEKKVEIQAIFFLTQLTYYTLPPHTHTRTHTHTLAVIGGKNKVEKIIEAIFHSWVTKY